MNLKREKKTGIRTVLSNTNLYQRIKPKLNRIILDLLGAHNIAPSQNWNFHKNVSAWSHEHYPQNKNLSSEKTGYILNLCTVYNDTHYFKQLPLNNATIDTFENLIRNQAKSNSIKKAKIEK